MRKEYKVHYDTGRGYTTCSHVFTSKEEAEAFAKRVDTEIKSKLAPRIFDYSVIERGDKLTCDEYLEILFDAGDLSSLFADMYWGHDFNSTRVFEYIQADAIKEGIILTDVDTWSYDEPIYQCYLSDDDKGLS